MSKYLPKPFFLLLSAVLLLGATAAPALAADVTIGCAISELIIAVSTASSGDTITLAAGCTYTFTTPSGANAALPDIDKTLTIEGSGAIIERSSAGGTPNFRLFYVTAAGDLTLKNVTVRNGATSAYGGAIRNDGGLSVLSTTFTNNTSCCTTGRGGAIYNNAGDLTVTNSTFTGNSAGGIYYSQQGGAIYTYQGQATVTGSTFTGNSAGHQGGAISSENSTLSVSESTFSSNSVNGVAGSGSSSADGGAIHNTSGGTVTVTDSVFGQNTAHGDSTGRGGAIANLSGSVTITGSTFIGNISSGTSSGGGGGAIESLGSTATTISDSVFTGNQATNGSGGVALGGALATYGGTVSFTNSTLANNSAGAGGAIGSTAGSITITNSTLDGNTTTSLGGAIRNQQTLTVTGSTLSNNSAASAGGAIMNFGTATIRNSTLAGNQASQAGGIMNNSGTTLKLTNSTVVGNRVSSIGGGIQNSGTAELGSTLVANNRTLSDFPSNLFGTFSSLGYNVVETSSGATFTGDTATNRVDADASPLNLGDLADNGGVTHTVALLVNSVAIGHGNCLTLPGTPAVTADQRGQTRKTPCDVGAYENQGVNVTGHIYQSNGSTPVGDTAWVDVTLYSDDSWVTSVSTDASGLYTIVGLPSGVYRLRGNAPGYAFEYYANAVTREASQAVTVGASGNIIGIDFTLDPEGTVSGHITGEGGTTPLANITLNVQLDGSGHDVAVSACTDANGDYTLFNVPLNVPLKITASRDGWNWCTSAPKVYIQEWWQNTPDFSAATPITLTQAQPYQTGIDFTLALGSTITGHVFESDGTTAITSGSVDAELIGMNIFVNGGVNPDGSFTLGGLAAGNYRIRASSNGYAWEYYDDAGQDGASAATVTVVAGATVPNIDFTLGPGGSISGTVTQADGVTPLVNMRVDIDNHWVGTCTDANGHFTISGLPLNTPLRVNAGGADNWCGGSPNYVYEYWQDAPNSQTATPVILTMANRDRTGIDFALVLGGAITGHFYESDGTTPITSNVWANVEPLFDGQAPGAGVEADGSYIIHAIAPGDYRVRAQGIGYAFEFYDEAGQNGSNATTVTVVAGATIGGVDFTLDPGGTISGTVTAADGTTPLANMRVDIDGVWAGTCTDANGHYTMSSLSLNTPLRVNAGGADNWCGGSPDYVYEYSDGARTSDATTPTLLTPAQPNRTDVNFALDLGGTVTGHVYESDGTTAITANAWVNVEPLFNGQSPGAGVQADGSYTISAVPPGEYRVRAQGNGYAFEFYDDAGQNVDNATIVTVVAGATVSGIDFALDPGGVISGVVTAEDGVTPLANIGILLGDLWFGQCTDADGRYSFNTVPLNVPVKISAGSWHSTNWCGAAPHDYVTEWWQETGDGALAETITLTVAQRERTDIDFTLEVGGSISGVVTDQDTGLPLANVNVNAHSGDYSVGACTDADGVYTIHGVPKGIDIIIGAATMDWCGENRYLREFWEETSSSDDALHFTLTDAVPTLTGIDFTLKLGGTVSGTVIDQTTLQPIPNVVVNAQFDTYVVGACTDADGHYTIRAVPKDVEFLVNAASDTWCGETDYVMEYWEETPDPDSATAITLTNASPDALGIDFTLQLGGAISGTVTAAENAAGLEGIWLCAFPYDAVSFDQSPPWQCVPTQIGGTYTIRAVPPGTHRLWIFPNDRLRLFYNNAPTFAGASAVAVTAGSTTPGIDFSLPLAAIISGTVTDANGQPMNGVTISLADGSYPECTQSDGSYRIWVPAGEHVVKAGAGMCNSGIDFPTQYYQWVTAQGEATTVTAVVGQTTPDVDFTLQVRLLGAVTLQGRGAPPDPRWVVDLSGAVSLPDPAPPLPFSVTTDQHGAFILSGLSTGPQRIWIKGEHTLANGVDVVLHYGDNPVNLGLLREGDADGSNGVTISDFSLLAASFGQSAGSAGYDARADFNDDNVVNISDFSLLATNFTGSGAEP